MRLAAAVEVVVVPKGLVTKASVRQQMADLSRRLQLLLKSYYYSNLSRLPRK